MAKIAYRTRFGKRTLLQRAKINVRLRDSELDILFRGVRRGLQAQADANIGDLTEAFVRVLTPVKSTLPPSVEAAGYDQDDYSAVLWDFCAAAKAGTKSAAVLEEFGSSEEAWADMVALLLLGQEAKPIEVIPCRGHRFSIAGSLLLGFILALACALFMVRTVEAYHCHAGTWKRSCSSSLVKAWTCSETNSG